MPTVFITANDTGVGKTWVTAAIARLLARRGAAVQVVKPVETGVLADGYGDAEWVAEALQEEVTLHGKVNCRTLQRFSQPLAPVEAAARDGGLLDAAMLADSLAELPDTEWRLVEGAGGLAVPLSSGANPVDWADFARDIEADYVVLVVEDRLGAINQARLLAHYAGAHGLNAGWWLNQVNSLAPDDVREINQQTLAELDFPLWGAQAFNAALPHYLEAPWLKS